MPFSFKYAALQQHEVSVKKKLERRVCELEQKLAQQENSGDTAAEVRNHKKTQTNVHTHTLQIGKMWLGESQLCPSILYPPCK